MGDAILAGDYTFINNTYVYQPQTNEKDLLQVEIGDLLQPDFKPQMKIKRWDNEVNFSARLVDDSLTAPTVSTSKEIIIWSTDKREMNFYDVPVSEMFPEGGYELEVILKSKPATNRTSFTIQTKCLKFAYQPALTETEKQQGAIRPDNVVGSYAAYHQNCPMNVVGGNLYKCGKVFHIYRPKIEDSAGNWTWGELSIDEAAGLLHVDIPQKFLDDATYPVRHAAGLTLGYTTAGASANSFNLNYWRAGRITTTAVSTIERLTMCFLHYADPSYKALITKDSDDSVVTNGVGSATYDGDDWGSKHWKELDFATSPVLSASTMYWIGAVSNDSSNFYYDTSMGSSYWVQTEDDNNYSSPAAPTSPVEGEGTAVSVYATYTVASSTSKTLTENLSVSGNILERNSQALTESLSVIGSVLHKNFQTLTENIAVSRSVLHKNFQTLTENLTVTGSLLHRIRKTFTENLSVVGSLLHRITKTISESLSASGSLLHRITKTISENISAAGSKIATGFITLLANMAISSAIDKAAGKVIRGNAKATGLITRAIARTITGLASAAGSVIKRASKTFSGNIDTAATIIRAASRIINGLISAAGNITRSTSKTISGNLTAAGSIIKDIFKYFSANISIAASILYIEIGGVVYKTVEALLAVAGNVTKAVAKSSVIGYLNVSASVLRTTSRILTGLAGASASASKATSRILSSASVLITGSSGIRNITKAISGAISAIGQVNRSFGRVLTAYLSVMGSNTKDAVKTVLGAVASAGGILKGTYKTAIAYVTITGLRARLFNKIITGLLSVLGIAWKRGKHQGYCILSISSRTKTLSETERTKTLSISTRTKTLSETDRSCVLSIGQRTKTLAAEVV